LKLRFLNWWQLGYNNAFKLDAARLQIAHGAGSVGLGGTIAESLAEFSRNGDEYTQTGDRWTAGNGGIMRLAPVAIYFHDMPLEAMRIAALQSQTTHRADEASECARLLAHILTMAMSHPVGGSAAIEDTLGSLHERFPNEMYSVECLAAGRREERAVSNKGDNLDDRDWCWKEESYRYSPSRSAEDPGYVGSYVMDALAMALHCVWTTRSFEDAVLKAVNFRGDADTVGAVTGQIAGALYGASSIPEKWVSAVQRWDGGGSIALRAAKLCARDHDGVK